MSAFLRAKKKIVSTFSSTSTGKKTIIRFLGDEGGKAFDVLLKLVEDFDGIEVRKEMEANILKLVSKAGLIYTEKLLDEKKTKQRLERPVARLIELLMQSTLAVTSTELINRADQSSPGRQNRRTSLTSAETRDVALRRELSRRGSSFNASAVPERNLVNKLMDSIHTCVVLFKALATGLMQEKNRQKISSLEKIFGRKTFLNFVIDSPVNEKERAILHGAFEFVHTVARFQPSDEALEEERELHRLRYEQVKDQLTITEFLSSPNYQHYLQSYLVSEHPMTYADSIGFYNAVSGYKEISNSSMFNSRAPGILRRYLVRGRTGVGDDELAKIKAAVDEKKANRRTFNAAAEEVFQLLQGLFQDFQSSIYYTHFLKDIFHIHQDEKLSANQVS
jgi:hypothetical protein|eukprot:Stramenopile-MAST_4_protein_3039